MTWHAIRRFAAIALIVVSASFLWACSQKPGKLYHEGTSGAVFGPNPNDR